MLITFDAEADDALGMMFDGLKPLCVELRAGGARPLGGDFVIGDTGVDDEGQVTVELFAFVEGEPRKDQRYVVRARDVTSIRIY